VSAQPSAVRSILALISNMGHSMLISLAVFVLPEHVKDLEPLSNDLNLPMLRNIDISPRLMAHAAQMATQPNEFRFVKLYTTLCGVVRATLQRDTFVTQLYAVYAFANIQTIRLGTPINVEDTVTRPFLLKLRRLEADLSSHWSPDQIAHAHWWLPAVEFVWCGQTSEHVIQMAQHLASAFPERTTTAYRRDKRSFTTTEAFTDRWIRVAHHSTDGSWSVETVYGGHLRRIESLLWNPVRELLLATKSAKLSVQIEANADDKALQVLESKAMAGLAAVAFELSPLLPTGEQLQRIRTKVPGRLGGTKHAHAIVEVHIWMQKPANNLIPTITEADMYELASGDWLGTTRVSIDAAVQVVSP